MKFCWGQQLHRLQFVCCLEVTCPQGQTGYYKLVTQLTRWHLREQDEHPDAQYIGKMDSDTFLSPCISSKKSIPTKWHTAHANYYGYFLAGGSACSLSGAWSKLAPRTNRFHHTTGKVVSSRPDVLTFGKIDSYTYIKKETGIFWPMYRWLRTRSSSCFLQTFGSVSSAEPNCDEKNVINLQQKPGQLLAERNLASSSSPTVFP